MKDLDIKRKVLSEILDSLDKRMLEQDIKPLHSKKSKLIVEAEGESPEDAKEKMLSKLSDIDLPDEDEMPDMEEMMSEEDLPMMEDDEEMEEEMEESVEGEDDEEAEFLASLSEKTREKYLARKAKK